MRPPAPVLAVLLVSACATTEPLLASPVTPPPPERSELRFGWPAGVEAVVERSFTMTQTGAPRPITAASKYELVTARVDAGLEVSLTAYRVTATVGYPPLDTILEGALLSAGLRWIVDPATGEVVRIDGVPAAVETIREHVGKMGEALKVPLAATEQLKGMITPAFVDQKALHAVATLGPMWVGRTVDTEAPETLTEVAALPSGAEVVLRSQLFFRGSVPCAAGEARWCVKLETVTDPIPVDPAGLPGLARTMGVRSVLEGKLARRLVIVLEPDTALPHRVERVQELRARFEGGDGSEWLQLQTTTDQFTYRARP